MLALNIHVYRLICRESYIRLVEGAEETNLPLTIQAEAARDCKHFRCTLKMRSETLYESSVEFHAGLHEIQIKLLGLSALHGLLLTISLSKTREKRSVLGIDASMARPKASLHISGRIKIQEDQVDTGISEPV
jgi:hypothetical protein